MRTGRLREALGQLRRTLAPPEGDAELLARFLANRDEYAFAALVRRHGSMVLAVCRRVLRHEQDAEDAFQATFLVLSRKAGSVIKRGAVGSWLYGVAYRTALYTRRLRTRRRAREHQVDVMPQPLTGPPESQDWRPLLDEELNRLPEKFRGPLVLCDLQGLSRREAARQLVLPDGTLSRRLTAGRRLLAQRLSRRGVTLSGGALAATLSQGVVSSQVSAALVAATAKAAALAAAGHLAAVATPAAVLTLGVLRAMFIAKAKVVVAAVLVVVALGAGGVAYHSETVWAGQAEQANKAKPRSEVEELRRQIELLRLNLDVVLEKVRAQEQELSTLRGKTQGAQTGRGVTAPEGGATFPSDVYPFIRKPAEPAVKRPAPDTKQAAPNPNQNSDYRRQARTLVEYLNKATTEGAKQPAGNANLNAAHRAEAALQALRAAQSAEARQMALDALDQAVRALHQQTSDPAGPTPLPRAK